MDTMEVDSSDLDGSRGLDDPEEPSTPEENMFDTDSPFLDREKDEEPIKTIRYEDVWLSCPGFFSYPVAVVLFWFSVGDRWDIVDDVW